MAKEKQYIFSARTTELGLRQLNEVKNQRFGVYFRTFLGHPMRPHQFYLSRYERISGR